MLARDINEGWRRFAIVATPFVALGGVHAIASPEGAGWLRYAPHHLASLLSAVAASFALLRGMGYCVAAAFGVASARERALYAARCALYGLGWGAAVAAFHLVEGIEIPTLQSGLTKAAGVYAAMVGAVAALQLLPGPQRSRRGRVAFPVLLVATVPALVMLKIAWDVFRQGDWFGAAAAIAGAAALAGLSYAAWMLVRWPFVWIQRGFYPDA